MILFTIEAWDSNCPKHIPQKFDAADVDTAMTKLAERITALEAENARLKQQIMGSPRSSDRTCLNDEATSVI